MGSRVGMGMAQIGGAGSYWIHLGTSRARSTPARRDTRRTIGPRRRSHLANPRRQPQPQTGPQTRHLDTRRPRLRSPPHRHAQPLPTPALRHRQRRRMDNKLSITCRKSPARKLPLSRRERPPVVLRSHPNDPLEMVAQQRRRAESASRCHGFDTQVSLFQQTPSM
jgi:hypothetical protein